MRDFGADVRSSAVDHMKRTSANEIIKKIKNWLTVDPDKANKRWPFELIQNAIDAASKKHKQVRIEMEVNYQPGSGLLIFRHDGGPFFDNEVCGIIYGGSTKREAFAPESEYIGRFGRGFLVSHVLNRKARITGIGEAKDGVKHRFTIVLDRTSDNENEIIDGIDRCLDSLSQSTPVLEDTGNEWFAEYIYELKGTQAEEAAMTGIATLERFILLLFAFNERLTEIRVDDKLFTKSIEDLGANLYLVSVMLNGKQLETKVLMISEAEVSEKLELGVFVKDGAILPIPSDVPRLFISMPLIGSEKIPIPFIISSPTLVPSDEREMLPLAGDEHEVKKNIHILKKAIARFYELMDACIEKGYTELVNLCEFHKIPEQYIDDKPKYWGFWQEQIALCVKMIQNKMIVETDIGRSKPSEVVFPTPKIQLNETTDGLNTETFGHLYELLRRLRKTLPVSVLAQDWQRIARGWKETNAGEEIILPLYSLETLSDEIKNASLKDTHFQSLDIVAKGFGIEPEEMKGVLIDFFKLVEELYLQDKLEPDFIDGLLLNGNDIIVSKNISIKDINGKSVDLALGKEASPNEIPPELGDLTAVIGYDIWAGLLDPSFALFKIVQKLLSKEITADYVIEEMLKYKLAPKSRVSFDKAKYLAWAKLLVWCIINDHIKEDLPLYSKDNTVITIGSMESWPLLVLPFSMIEIDEEYEELMPNSRVLNSKYFDLMGDSEKADSFRKNIVKFGICSDDVIKREKRLSVKKKKMKKMLTDEDAPLRGDEHILTAREGTLSYFLFSGDVIGSVSQRPDDVKKFIFFVAKVLCERDRSWSSVSEVDCSCGTPHRVYPSLWLADLKCDEWVAQQEDGGDVRHSRADRQILDKVLSPEDMMALINLSDGIELLSKLGFDKLDLTVKRSCEGSPSEEKVLRAQLSHLIDVAPDLNTVIQYIESSKEKARKVRDNQAIGKIVEEILYQVFVDEGVTKFKITGIGSDAELWPSEEGVDCGTIETESYLVEIKFTTGNRARLSKKQADTAVSKGGRYCVLVVEGDVSLKEQLLRDYTQFSNDEKESLNNSIAQRSMVTGHISDKLLAAPSPEEIEPDINGYWIKDLLWAHGDPLRSWISLYIRGKDK